MQCGWLQTFDLHKPFSETTHSPIFFFQNNFFFLPLSLYNSVVLLFEKYFWCPLHLKDGLAKDYIWDLTLLFFFNVFSSVAQSCLTLCDPMGCSTPGLPVHHQLLEFTQTHVHCVGDAIQSSHPLSSPSPPAFNLSQHQGLFQWVSSSHQVAKVLEFQLQHQSFQWVFRTDFL